MKPLGFDILPQSNASVILRDLAMQLEIRTVIMTDLSIAWSKVNGRDHFRVLVEGFQGDKVP